METTLRRLRRRFVHWNRWLNSRHPYANLVKDIRFSERGVDGDKLAEYVASSILLHVADGWVFLARAFDAIMRGDRNTAAHMAYYAELRAAMSLLASEGIGIFAYRHFAIGPSSGTKDWKKGGGTHQATWRLLNSWASDVNRTSTLLTAIKIENKPIGGWLDDANVSPSVQHLVARNWLESWSIDLKHFEGDRELRNYASYRPMSIKADSWIPLDTSVDVVKPLLKTWDALEPSGDVGGASIDRALLYRALQLAHNEGSHVEPTWDHFMDRLKGVVSPGLEFQLRDPAANENHVLRWANQPPEKSNPPKTNGVLARATLLLRIASGVCAQRLSNAGISKTDLRFWWSRFGVDFGLWPEGVELDTFSELWADVNDAIVNTEDALGSTNGTNNMFDIGRHLGQHVELTQHARVPLWLLQWE